MNRNKKLIVLGLLLVVLAGCTSYINPETGRVYDDKIIFLGDAWIWGVEGWFSAIFVWPIAQLLNFFAQHVGAFLSIVIVTLLIKLITLRFTVKSTIQQQKIQLIQPEVARLEEKYRGRTDQQSKMQKATETQKIYEKHGINPMAGIGGMFLQLPIMFAMYQAVVRANEIIEGTILGESLKITPLEGIKQLNIVIIIVYILMIIFQAASQFLPQYLAKRKLKKRPGTPKPAGPNTNVMLLASLAMIVFFALNWPVGMSLYWMVSSITQILQTLFIQWRYGEK